METSYVLSIFDMSAALKRAFESIRSANVSLSLYANTAFNSRMVKRIDPEWIAQKATDIEKLAKEVMTVTSESLATFTTPPPATANAPGAPLRAAKRRIFPDLDEEEEKKPPMKRLRRAIDFLVEAEAEVAAPSSSSSSEKEEEESSSEEEEDD